MIIFIIYALVYVIIGDMIWKWIHFTMEKCPHLYDKLEDLNVSMQYVRNVIVFLWPLLIIRCIYNAIKNRR